MYCEAVYLHLLFPGVIDIHMNSRVIQTAYSQMVQNPAGNSDFFDGINKVSIIVSIIKQKLKMLQNY